MIVSPEGDTCAIISVGQMRQINIIHLELNMCYEIIDSLVANDEKHFYKEQLMQEAIKVRDEHIQVLEKIQSNDSNIIAVQSIEIEKCHRQLKLCKWISGGAVFALIVSLIMK